MRSKRIQLSFIAALVAALSFARFFSSPTAEIARNVDVLTLIGAGVAAGAALTLALAGTWLRLKESR